MNATLVTNVIVNGKRFMTFQDVPLKIRKTWDFRVASRVVPDKTKYTRKNKRGNHLTAD